jgi:hypothetical protein
MHVVVEARATPTGTDDPATPAVATGEPPAEKTTDAHIMEAMGLGLAVGIPALFLATTLILLFAGLSLKGALLVAIVPAFFGGGYFGGFALLLRSSE